MPQRISPFRLMNTVFLGLVMSLAYSLGGAVLLFFYEGKSESLAFLEAYNSTLSD
jgi:hypothetical protein